MTIIWLIVLVASLYALTKAADKFTDSAEIIGKWLKMPSFVVGILIVALGTSIPELATSIFGIIRGDAGVLSGNVTGSTITNIFLGLGLVVVISKKIAKFNWDSVSNDMPFLAAAAALLYLTISDGKFEIAEAILFLITYVVYVIYSLQIKKMNPKEIREDLKKEISSRQRDVEKEEKKDDKKISKTKIIIYFFISLVAIFISAKFAVDSLIELAVIFGIGTSTLSASLIAIGTSLPEISVGISSAKKGNFDMVIGNIMGSNIFNILVVFGTIGLFTPIIIPEQVITLILPMMVAAIFIQWLITIDKKITITEGLLMILLYVTFIGKLFNIF